MSYVIYIIIIFFNICASNANIIQETVHQMDHSMNETGTRIDQHQMLDFTLDKKYTLQNTLELINGHLEQFNSLYITRLDQKLLSLVTYVSSMDSNIKNIQERAHIWDTFQLHVSAWNDQIKTLDRKVDIINSGQERMALLENRLGVLLNLEYNTQRALNKLSSMEDRMDKVELALMRLADLHGREESRLEHQLAGRGLLVSLKQMEMKIDRNFALMRKPGNSKIRFFDKRNSNQTLVGRKLLIKCSTPPALEELIKDTASKVDLIFDKLSVDGTSDEEAKKHEPSDDLEDIEHDYSVEMYQNDPGEDLVKTAQKKPNY